MGENLVNRIVTSPSTLNSIHTSTGMIKFQSAYVAYKTEKLYLIMYLF